ncbi:MAG: hypothetical protein U0795_12105 [Pirellulales bacterium]
MRRRPHEQSTSIGEEGYLNVVGQLVGILVVLVVVVGMSARGAWEESQRKAEANQAPSGPTLAEVEAQLRAANAKMESLKEANARILLDRQRMQAEIAMRQMERDRLNMMRAQIEQEIKAQRENWSRAQQHSAQLKDQIDANEQELAKLKLRLEQLSSAEDETVVLEHVPTPMAQTVFGNEEHYRLLGGRLAYVPLNALIEELKTDARQRLPELKNSNEITASIGPLQGFTMRYQLARQVLEVDTRFGTQTHELGQLIGFELIADSDQLGEPIAELTRPGSILHDQLLRWPASKTVITVWTYPDSYDDFRRLRDYLQGLGYLCAARPLPAGQPISGSPQGTRSAAQ